MVAGAGDVGQRAQQAARRPAVRIHGGLGGGPLRPEAADDGGHPDGGPRARRARTHDLAVGVLRVLSGERAGVRLRRTTAPPGVALTLVRQGARQRPGLRGPRPRGWWLPGPEAVAPPR